MISAAGPHMLRVAMARRGCDDDAMRPAKLCRLLSLSAMLGCGSLGLVTRAEAREPASGLSAPPPGSTAPSEERADDPADRVTVEALLTVAPVGGVWVEEGAAVIGQPPLRVSFGGVVELGVPLHDNLVVGGRLAVISWGFKGSLEADRFLLIDTSALVRGRLRLGAVTLRLSLLIGPTWEVPGWNDSWGAEVDPEGGLHWAVLPGVSVRVSDRLELVTEIGYERHRIAERHEPPTPPGFDVDLRLSWLSLRVGAAFGL